MAVAPADQAIQDRPSPSPQPAPPIALMLPSPGRAAALIALSWLPAAVLAAGLPRFVPTFDRWRWELPALTQALMSVGRLGFWPIVLAAVVLVAVLAAAGAGWVRAGLPGRRAVPFALAAAGLVALAVGMAGTLGPLFTVRIP